MVWRFWFIDFHVSIIFIGRMMRQLHINLIKFGTFIGSAQMQNKSNSHCIQLISHTDICYDLMITIFGDLPGCFVLLEAFGCLQNPFDRTTVMMHSGGRCWFICCHNLRRKKITTTTTTTTKIHKYNSPYCFQLDKFQNKHLSMDVRGNNEKRHT